MCGFEPPPKFVLKVSLLLGQHLETLGKGGQLGKLQKSESHSWKDLERSRYPIPESGYLTLSVKDLEPLLAKVSAKMRQSK